MSQENKIFAKGMYSNKVNMGNWSFDKVSFKVDDFVAFLNEHKNEKGYVIININDIKTPVEGKNNQYCQLDTWKPNQNSPTQTTVPSPSTTEKNFSDDLPF